FAVFGPGKAAAQLEGSKGFTKALCGKYGIPTAAYQTFTEPESAKRHARGQRFPLVIKADGLAAGKGVVIAASEEDAVAALDSMFAGAFGAAGQRVVIEEFLEGEEVSFFALSDGETAVEFGHAQDHKRAFDRDQGPNTGGMGAYSPASCMTDGLRAQVMETIILPTVAAMKREGMPFQGVLFAGLMLTREGPKLLEYNARFGDPETQALMVRLESDLYALLSACAEGKLGEMEIRFHPGAALCVVMAADGYPGSYRQGTRIYGLEEAAAVPGVMIFHAGTAREGGEVIATGGRVLGVTARGGTIAEAQSRAYQAVDRIVWPEGFCRRDIGWRAIAAA
ncbi:MAG: phosphoribosylamine--glycine ligase, partial [Alphaproteobacteria bacterium]|nr:phosphoribosylamine--glycine ligase [Alphaproteobacteria bacterium]